MLDLIRWDRRTGRYRHKSGRLVARALVLELIRDNIAYQGKELVALADQLASQEITLEEFQTRATNLIKRLHIQSAIVGHGGIDQMTPDHWLEVANELRRQFYDGKDPVTGQRFGFKFLVQSIAQNLVSLPQLKNALRMFASSAKISFFRGLALAAKLKGTNYGIRVLGKSNSCEDCIRYAALPPLPLDRIVLPTQQCRCRTNCGCSIQPLSLSEAMSRGLKP